MTRLSEELHSSLTKPVLQKLFGKSIFTTTEFIKTDSGLLLTITGLEYLKIIEIRNAILKKLSSPIRYGDYHYQDTINNGAIISSGIERLDHLINGGFSTGLIYELCGLSASGKTQLCMSVAVNISSKLEKQKVLYIDSKNDLYAHRIMEILGNRKSKTKDTNEVMNKIKIIRIKSAYELITLLNLLINELKNSAENSYRVVIIDSLAAIFYQFLGDEQNEGLCLLNNVTNLLRYMAVEHYVAVIVTNLTTTWTSEILTEERTLSQTIRQPALGRYWIHVPGTRINIQKFDSVDEILLTILKSFDQPVGKTIKLTISNEGVT